MSGPFPVQAAFKSRWLIGLAEKFGSVDFGGFCGDGAGPVLQAGCLVRLCGRAVFQPGYPKKAV